MTLQYDIDISYVMPPEAFRDSGSAELLRASGLVLNARSNYIAKFRDPDTVAALAGASDGVKAYFEACGFAFIASGKTLPDGEFDERFDNQLGDVAKRLQENLSACHLKDEIWNGFDLGDCILAIEKAQAVEVVMPAAPKSVKRHNRQPFWINLLRPQIAFAAFALTLLMTFQYVGMQQFSSTMAEAEFAPSNITGQ